MMIIGIGCAKSRTNSTEPLASNPSTSSFATWSMSGFIVRTRWVVKRRSRNPRTRVCRGGSDVEHDASGSQPPAV